MAARLFLSDLTAEMVRAAFSYDAETGIFSDLRKYHGRKPRGAQAGSLNAGGYRLIGINYRNYKASRLAWLYSYGVWPTKQIDHKNGKRDDDRLANLREATSSENGGNKKQNSHANSPYKGIRFCNRYHYWLARIQVRGHRREFGGFRTPEAARDKYIDEARRAFGEFARAE